MAFTAFDPSTHTSQDLVSAILVPGTGLTIVPGSINLKYGTGTTYDSASGTSTSETTYDSASGTSTSKTSVSFYNGTLPLEIGPGILLTSGNGTPPLSNTSSSYTLSFGDSSDSGSDFDDSGSAVDPELQAVATAAFSGAGDIRDASILSFTVDVVDPNVKSIRFDLVFGSDEYPEWVNSSYVDIAAVLVNGANYALFNDQPDQPLSVIQKNLDLGNFIDNTGNTLPIEYDGISHQLTIIAPAVMGTNHIKIGVADTGDQAYDSGLFVANVQGVGYTGAGLAQVINVTSTQSTIAPTQGDYVYELPEEEWSGVFDFSSATPGNKTIIGGPEDFIKAIFDFSLDAIQDAFYTAFNTLSSTNSLSLTTPYGEYSFAGIDIAVFQDAAYALDTYQGGDTWQAYALYDLVFGAPSTQALTQWVIKAQSAPDFASLAEEFLQTYAPSASLEEVVGSLYGVVTGLPASLETITSVITELAASGLDTSAEILAFAAENFADTTPILGQPILLDSTLI